MVFIIAKVAELPLRDRIRNRLVPELAEQLDQEVCKRHLVTSVFHEAFDLGFLDDDLDEILSRYVGRAVLRLLQLLQLSGAA